MNTIARREVAVLAVALCLFLLFFGSALAHARRERRDGVRREEVAAIKTALEHYNNQQGMYPVHFETGENQYVVTQVEQGGAASWYLRTALENNPRPTAGFDQEAGRNYYYRIVKEGTTTFYEICGGNSTCGMDKIE